MHSLSFTTAYKKGYKRMQKRGADMSLLNSVVDQLRCGKRLDEKYRDHQLEGAFNDFRECHIKPDWLLIYKIEEDVLVLTLTNTGTHADLFNL